MFAPIFLLGALVYLLPLFLISGALLSDISISILALYIIYRLIFLKDVFINQKIFYLFIVFWIFLIISSIFSGFFLETYKSSVFYFRFGFYAFAIAFLSLKTINFNNFMMKSLIVTISILLIDSILQFLFQFNYLLNKPLDDFSRISSFFGDEKILGGYLLHLTPLIIYLMFKNDISEKFIILFYCFASIGIYISGERTSILLFFLMTTMFLIFLNLDLKYKFILGISLIILFFIVTVYSSNLSVRLSSQTLNEIFEKNDEGSRNIYIFSKGHTLLYLTSIEMFLNNYFIGIGPKVFRYLCADPLYIKIIDDMVGCSTHPHNYYIQILAEVGIFGFLFLSAVFVYLLVQLFKTKNNNCKKSILICCLIALFPFTPDGNFFNNWISILLYLPLGFYMVEYNLISNENNKK